MLLTVDIGRLEDAVQAGITQPIKSDLLDKSVPAQFRDPEGHWYGVSMRARVVYASKERVKQNAITYEELADPKWKGKICIRSGQHIYNNALFAAFIAKHGTAKAEEWLSGLKANLAQKPSGGDRETARDVAAGKCDLGIGNTYYWALMHDKDADKKAWADATKVILPTFQGGGTHVNLSGVGARQACPQQGQRHQADRMAGRRQGAAHVCRSELRVSGTAGHRGQLHDRRLWPPQRRPVPLSRSPNTRKRRPISWTRSVLTTDDVSTADGRPSRSQAPSRPRAVPRPAANLRACQVTFLGAGALSKQYPSARRDFPFPFPFPFRFRLQDGVGKVSPV